MRTVRRFIQEAQGLWHIYFTQLATGVRGGPVPAVYVSRTSRTDSATFIRLVRLAKTSHGRVSTFTRLICAALGH